MKLTLGFSPCPNDTFIFDAMVNGKIDTGSISFDFVFEDVETLNKWALQEKLDITKLSYNTFLNVVDRYALLHSGSALGKGVGPLVVARQPFDISHLPGMKIAIPGTNTTANLLLSLAFPSVQDKVEYIFSDIEDAVLGGEVDVGLIIHENRFTYQAKGLHKIIDLGNWWEQSTGAAIPLGGIVMRRKFDAGICRKVDEILKQSISYAWNNYPALNSFVTDNAQEMEEDVMRQHIELYVNEYTTGLGDTGRHAIGVMFEKAAEAGIIAAPPTKIFY